MTRLTMFEIKSNELRMEDGKLQVKEKKLLSDKGKALISAINALNV